MKTLLVTIDFPPLTGGIAHYYLNRVQKMPREKIVILMNKVKKSETQNVQTQKKIYYKNFFIKSIWPHWLPCIWHIWRIVKKEKIERIWVGQVLPVGTATWLVVKLLNILDPGFRRDDKKLKFFVTCHGNDILLAQNSSRKFKLASKILKNAEFIEANTKFVQDILISDYKIDAAKIKVIYPECNLDKNMINPNRVEELKKLYNLTDKKVLLTVARLVKGKGIDKVIQALPLVLEKIPNLTYLIVGDGSEKENLKNVGTGLDLSDRIIFAGNVFHSDLPNFYALANAFILTPTDTESFGIVYLEAQEFGLPIIAGRSGGVEEIKYNQMHLVNSQDIKEIAEKIIQIL